MVYMKYLFVIVSFVLGFCNSSIASPVDDISVHGYKRISKETILSYVTVKKQEMITLLSK